VCSLTLLARGRNQQWLALQHKCHQNEQKCCQKQRYGYGAKMSTHVIVFNKEYTTQAMLIFPKYEHVHKCDTEFIQQFNKQ